MPPSQRTRQRDTQPTPGGNLSGTNLERAGDHNQRVMLQAIRVSGQITRAELVTITGLTVPAIANITRRLLNDGLIQEVGRLHGARGQPAMRLAVNPDGAFSIGVNIDRDHITLLILDLLGQVRARATLDVDFALPAAVRAFCAAEIDTLLRAGNVDAARLIGIGVALPDDLGRVALPNRPADYAQWDSVDLTALLGDILPGNLPVFLENDAAAAALGEMQFGHGLHDPNFFYILISGGLGGGLVIDGSYFRGAQGRSGEIGFLPVHSPRTPARTLQEAVSLSALYAWLEAAGQTVRRPDDLERLPPAGQTALDAWLDLAADLLTQPLMAVSCLVNPEAVFMGGRLPGPLIDRLADLINRRLAAYVDTVPVIAPVRRAAMAADAPAVGAAILPFNDRLFPRRSTLRKTATPTA